MKKNKSTLIINAILIFFILIGVISILTRKPKEAVKPHVAIKGKIAIVLDDWGYNLADLKIIEEIRYPLTLAVLPNINYSRQVSEELHAEGFEIILHLPMEPEEQYGLEKNTIMVSFDEARILNIIDKDLANIVYAKGVSNHMGSRVTSDSRTMAIIFKELKRRRLYFLDSFVTSKSVCLDLAHSMNLKVAKRDIFLDNKEEREYIKQQLIKLKDKAKKRGFAVGIGHDRKVTLTVLKEMLPKMAKEGYKFVFLSELTQ